MTQSQETVYTCNLCGVRITGGIAKGLIVDSERDRVRFTFAIDTNFHLCETCNGWMADLYNVKKKAKKSGVPDESIS